MDAAPPRLQQALADRYALKRKLGEGGMASVYLAEDLKHERKVALKVLKPELAAVIGAERFLAEIKTTANLQHPHILPLFDSGEADGFLFYVMPFVEDETLRDRLTRERQLPVDEAVRIARSVAGALQAAHDAGVIHRDIKPENILLSRGEPLVSDFGIALAVSHAGGGRLTETGLSLGTPYYMSPEQATADRDPGKASDVYSLGCVLYEMLVGDPPHTGSSAQAVLAKILTEEPRAVTTLRRTVPTHVADAVARSLERLPADRFDSADAFARALGDQGFRHTVAGAAPMAQPAAAGLAQASAHPRPLLTTMAPWAVAFGALGVAAWGWMRGGPSEAVGPTELFMDPGADSLASFAFVTVSPDGRTFAMDRRDGSESPLYIRTADNPEWRALPGTDGAALPTFSPSGERIAYVTDEDDVMTVSVAGGSPLTLYESGNGLFEIHWAANGDIVVSAEEGIRRLRASGGVDTLALEGTIWWPYGLPDGSGVLFAEGVYGQTSIRIVDSATDSTRTLLEEGSRPIYLESGHILFAHPDGGLQVVPFDLGSHRVTGAPVPVRDGVVDRGFAVSASGTLVYRSNLDAAAVRKTHFLLVGPGAEVDTLRLPERNQRAVTISPDGTRMAFVIADDQGEGAQIHTYDLARNTGPTQLTFQGRNDDPVWSPDGSRIVYQLDRRSIFVKAVNGGTPGEPLWEDSVDVWPSSWTTTDEVVVSRSGGGNSDLVRLAPSDTTGPTELLRTDFRESNAAVSPDGGWFAYESNETDQPEVFVRSYPDALGPWRVSRGLAFSPAWSPDGGSVYYIRPSSIGTGAIIERVTVQLEPVFALGDPVEVWSGRVRDFAVHPDGERLVVIEAVQDQSAAGGDDEPSQIVVVLDWFGELRDRLGGGS